MNPLFETEFRMASPETIGETDWAFDMANYIEWLEQQLTDARNKIKTHKCVLPESIQWALNSGDGVYRP